VFAQIRVFGISCTVIGVFFAVNRTNVRGILVQIGSADPEFLAVRVDPLP